MYIYISIYKYINLWIDNLTLKPFIKIQVREANMSVNWHRR